MQKLILALLLASGGCALNAVGVGPQTAADVQAQDDNQQTTDNLDNQMSSGPQLVTPATGGAPVLAMPIGGTLYMPVTGGPPIVGV
jgi:hypothetical protein